MAHGHGGHVHHHLGSGAHDRRRLAGALGVMLAVMALEIAAGVVGRSLALLSDAAHAGRRRRDRLLASGAGL
jgi:cobalt-zinc-cadmium efflux system protein